MSNRALHGTCRTADHGCGRRFVRREVAIAIGTLCVPFSSIAFAQQDSGVANLGRIEVTGSNVKRIEGESGLPVQVMTRQELLNGGVQTMQELLQRISANQSFGSFNENMGEGSLLVGYTGASLRGLGAQRTLILLNGRRLAPYALSGGQSVDLSGIPASALERVEILKDGASAVYGTDAIGGVINFILRKDFSGVELNANYYGTEHGGGDNWRVSGTAGVGSLTQDRYNFFISADYFKQDSLKASQRESTKTAYLPYLGLDRTSSFAYPANIRQPGGFSGQFNPTIPFPGGATPQSCAPPFSFPQLRRPFQCGFDYASVIDTIPEAEKTNVIARFTWQIDADNQFFAEGAYYYGTFTQRVSPTPVSSLISVGGLGTLALPPTSPYYPTAFVAGLPHGDPTLPVEPAYRTVELGPRVDKANVDQWNAVAGLQGTIKGWDYTLAGTYTSNRQVDNYKSGYIYESTFGPLMRSGVINPFGPNTPATLDLMRATQVTGEANDNRASNYGAALKIGNDVYTLPAGPVAVALGVEGRKESLEQTNSAFIVSGDVLGGAGAVPSTTTVTRTVWSLFGEVNVPVVQTLEANLAVRYDHYSDFGGTTNPKFTLRWQPAKALLLRASYGMGFRAPTLSDLFLPQTIGFDESFPDPIRCPVTGADEDCNGVHTKGGGNPALQPERSQQLNAGIVVEPISGLSASVDYYWVKVENVIDTLGLDAILGPGGDYAHFAPTYVVRQAPDSQYPNLPGPIAYVVQYPTNVGEIKTSGLDFNLQWRGPATSFGQFTFSLDSTYVINYEHTGFESGVAPASVGTRANDGVGAIAQYRQYAQLNWTLGPWGATLANTYQSGYRECDLLTVDQDGNCTSTRKVGAYSVWDLQGRYTGIKNATLSVGVRNLFDRSPPVSNQQTTFQAGIDPSYADPRGRIYYAAIQYAFK
jgi:iron complex outermembrane receptor protein